MISENSIYYPTQKAFDDEASKEGIFNKNLTDCDRLSIDFLKTYVHPWMKVLEIGCGMGNVIEALECERYGIDLSPKMIEKCNIENKLVGNMDELPYEDETFYVTFMIMTMQHSKDREKTLSEMNRVTKEGGWMFIIDGDKDSGIGGLREQGIKEGTWYRVGDAKWLSRDDFPDWEATHLAEHIICLFKQRDNDWTICKEAMDIIIDYIQKEKPKVIVEIGSGLSTVRIAKEKPHCSLFMSYERKKEWFERTLRLTKGLDVIVLNEKYPDLNEINLLLIDGPEGENNRLARLPPKEVLDSVKGAVFIHDTKRTEEKTIANIIGNPTFYDTKWGLARIDL